MKIKNDDNKQKSNGNLQVLSGLWMNCLWIWLFSHSGADNPITTWYIKQPPTLFNSQTPFQHGCSNVTVNCSSNCTCGGHWHQTLKILTWKIWSQFLEMGPHYRTANVSSKIKMKILCLYIQLYSHIFFIQRKHFITYYSIGLIKTVNKLIPFSWQYLQKQHNLLLSSINSAESNGLLIPHAFPWSLSLTSCSS